MKALFMCLLFISETVYSQVSKDQIELDGFMLGQYRNAVHNQIGQPAKRIDTNDGWIYEFHILKSDSSIYSLFKYSSSDTSRIKAMQINGIEYNEMYPFLGLKLGDSQELVRRALGDPTSFDSLKDSNILVQYYDKRNYSVKIDSENRICGIQIDGFTNKRPKEGIPSLTPFQHAIISSNIDSLLNVISPDIEIYKDDKVISFVGAARSEFQKGESALVKLLLGPTKSVKAALLKEKNEPIVEMRLYPERKINTATVFKFKKSRIISEIVFTPHAGRWKVYEIRFKK